MALRLATLLAAAVALAAGCSIPTEQRTAEQVMRELVVRVGPAQPSVVFTAETDPNGLLGRPGGYTSKATFVDDRIDVSQVVDNQPGAVDLGGSVEVFENAAGARQRADYVEQVTQALPAFAEYDYVFGPVLLRVSGQLTPGQAAAYEAALAEIVG